MPKFVVNKMVIVADTDNGELINLPQGVTSENNSDMVSNEYTEVADSIARISKIISSLT